MYFVHLGGELLRQCLCAIHNHGIAIRTSSSDGNLAQRVARLVPLLAQAGNDANGGIVLVQSGCELLPCAG